MQRKSKEPVVPSEQKPKGSETYIYVKDYIRVQKGERHYEEKYTGVKQDDISKITCKGHALYLGDDEVVTLVNMRQRDRNERNRNIILYADSYIRCSVTKKFDYEIVKPEDEKIAYKIGKRRFVRSESGDREIIDLYTAQKKYSANGCGATTGAVDANVDGTDICTVEAND